ncbi:glycosyltransferase family 4 protein [Oceanobacillus kimchii]|uniref:glycosyltransferase family 4 protein n=1 Tax=Oceanobacillus kimchii TaxID=746691 RepID=UPI0021A6917D|nr:glycosyltransferase family 4 protein [Oceanobacillus kimchii]MCT2134616.1 glycosyltransferase family 4 protein [Oceanobacillus kimchii]
MKKILILSNHHSYTYNFRKEIIQALIKEGYKVILVLPYGQKVEILKKMGCEFIDLPLDRRGMNPITDMKLFLNYRKIIKRVKPDVVLTYTVKPNLYGGIACRISKVPFFPNITGLGSAVENKSSIQRLLLFMSKQTYKNASCVFFQNQENKHFFEEHNIKLKNYKVIPGSGVNTSDFSMLPYPSGKTIEFLYISRIMKQKGIEQYLDAAKYIKSKYNNVKFHVLGFCEEDYESELRNLHDKGIIEYHGMQDDVRKFHRIAHCIIHPTYYPEGMSNVLLECAASGRPIITTNRSGCREIVDDGINGFIVEQKDSKDLISKIEEFLKLTITEKTEMGKAARKKIEREFERDLIVDAYVEEVSKINAKVN